MDLLSKTEFAALIGVSGARVSQYLKSGMIGSDCLVEEPGSGRVKIIAQRAAEQIRRKRSVGQALSNGLGTKLDLTDASTVAMIDATRTSEGMAEARPIGVDDQLKAARLELEQRKNRIAAVEEAQSLAKLILGEDMQREIARSAQSTVNAFMGMAPDIANAIAAKFGLPQRDVLHLVRQTMNERRGIAATTMLAEAEAMPTSREAIIA